MDTIVSHSSALQAWFELIASGDAPWRTARVRHASGFDARSVHRAARLLGLPEPVHVLVGGASSRRWAPDARCHVWSRDLPPRAVARVADGILVATPEFLFLQAAHALSFEELVLLGYELCALYTCRIPAEGYRELPRPLTTAARIETFLGGCAGCRGIRAARAAIRWVRDRSRSPRETKLMISLVLPRMRGGQAVRGIELNRRIELTPEEQRAAGKRYFEVDILDPSSGVGLEYYGVKEHSGKMREIGDIRRESILAGKGIRIHGVTQVQSESVMELERLAWLFHDAQGIRWRVPSPQQEQRMLGLLQTLYLAKNSLGEWS